jgi:hypothetical protein
MSVRLNAVKELQKEYPNYLGNLSQEAILSGQAAGEVDKLATALFKRALAESEANKAAELGNQNFELQGKALFLLQEQQKATKELADAQKQETFKY